MLPWDWMIRPRRTLGQVATAVYDQSNPLFDTYVTETVNRINAVVPDDDNYAQGAIAYGTALANYWGAEVANDSRVQRALENLRQRYQFARSQFGSNAVILPAGSSLPSGSGAHQPIVLADHNGNFQYAPGFGPASQYGSSQVYDPSRPAQPQVNAYSGQTSSQPLEVVLPQVPANSVTAESRSGSTPQHHVRESSGMPAFPLGLLAAGVALLLIVKR
jgi:hypothetical protein